MNKSMALNDRADPSPVQIKRLQHALKKTHELLSRNGDSISYDEIHAVKSLLYAVLEQVGVKAERLSSLQRLLRELFAVFMSVSDLKRFEKKAGIQILEEIKQKYFREL